MTNHDALLVRNTNFNGRNFVVIGHETGLSPKMVTLFGTCHKHHVV